MVDYQAMFLNNQHPLFQIALQFRVCKTVLNSEVAWVYIDTRGRINKLNKTTRLAQIWI